MVNKIRYIQFPIYMLSGIWKNKRDAFINMIIAGCLLYKEYISFTMEQVAGQIIYHYTLSNNGNLPKHLRKFLNDHAEEAELSERGYHFHHNQFEPQTEALEKVINNHSDIKKQACDWFQLITACNYFNMPTEKIDLILAKNGQIKIDGEPIAMVKYEILYDFYIHEKSEFDLAQFAAYAALKSIIGKRKYCLTNKNHIVSRMFGYRSVKEIPETPDPRFQKYRKRYQIDRILEYLQLNWKLKVPLCSGLHGLYVSFSDDISLTDLSTLAAQRMLKTKRQKLQSEKQAAQATALQQLNKGKQLKKAAPIKSSY